MASTEYLGHVGMLMQLSQFVLAPGLDFVFQHATNIIKSYFST